MTVPEMERLHHSTVEDLDKLYMQSAGRGCLHPALSVLMRSPSARDIIIAPLSATWSGHNLSGSVAKDARKLASTSFSRVSVLLKGAITKSHFYSDDPMAIVMMNISSLKSHRHPPLPSNAKFSLHDSA